MIDEDTDKMLFGNDTDVNRTRPNNLVIERFPVLKEEIGFRREVMLVPASAMENLVTTSLCCNSSHDCRALVKAVLIWRREIASYRNDNNRKFTIEEHGFKEQCQETSVPVGLKFLVGMITRGPSAEETVTETQATCLLQYYNESDKCHSHRDTPPGIHWTLLLRSFKIQEWRKVEELARLGLSVN